MEKERMGEKLAKQDWKEIHARLVDFASHRARSPELGKDLAQAAITRVLAGDSPWDPEKQPDLRRHLMSVVNGLLRNDLRTARVARTDSYDHHGDDDEEEAYPDERAFGEERVAEGDLYSRRIARFRGRLAENKDEDVRVLLEQTILGVDAPADLREATGWSLEKVNRVRARMHHLAAEIAREVTGDDDGGEVQ